MNKTLRIALAQVNLTVGDITGNLDKHLQAAQKARDELKADVIVFPELGLSGYPPEDLLYREKFLHSCDQAFNQFMREISGIYCLISHPLQIGDELYNACTLLYNGQIVGRYAKSHLPNYGVFDEKRYFSSGKEPCVAAIKDIPVGLLICEDLWFQSPIQQAAANGARLILSVNASPFEVDKHQTRIKILAKRAQETGLPIVYVNLVGGQDEIIHDGGSLVMDQHGELCDFAGYFNETILLTEIDFSNTEPQISPKRLITLPSDESKIYEALVLSVKDYVNKNNFKGVLLGLSGGIDSALTLAIAADAIGGKNVKAIIMPSRHTAEMSITDASAIADNLQVAHEIISIEPLYQAALNTLAPAFQGTNIDKTEENLQARCRAMILMALSNKFGSLVLSTGNRSELAVGYCTLYGDMAGGFCVLKDIPKTMVYALSHYRNSISPVIPANTIERAPSAELAPNQKDEDSLPPYSILDQILYYYLNRGESIQRIAERGFDIDTVKRIIRLVQSNEYKRRQAAIGPRVNHKSFGKGWRYPITNRFKE